MLELALQTKAIRDRHGPDAEKALADLFFRTGRGAAQRQAARDVTRALEALAGQTIEKISVTAAPGRHTITINTDRAHLTLSVDRGRRPGGPRRGRRVSSLSMSTGFTVWFTGLSGAGKTTLSARVAEAIRTRGTKVEVLDGDVVRTNLSKGLGFSREDRDTNIRRIGFVAKLLTRNDVAVVVAAISPYRAVRDEVRAEIGAFVEVFVRCPVEELIRRDVKGLYERALRGEVAQFTGVSDPYEEPLNPEVVVDTDRETVEESVGKIVAALERLGYLPAASPLRVASAGSTLLSGLTREPALLDDLGGLLDHSIRDAQPECLRRLEIDHEVKRGRLLDGESAGFAPRRILST